MQNQNEIKPGPPPLITLVECKGCQKTFKSNSIQKHLYQTKKNCLKQYSQSEINLLKEQSKKFSAYKEKQWKNENKSHIAETYSRYYQTNKEEILKKQGTMIPVTT